MPVKCTMLLQLATNVDFPDRPQRRIGGWSESWYFPGASIPDAIAAFTGQGVDSFTSLGVCGFRAELLPTGASIVGQRFQVVNPTGPAQSTSFFFPGGSELAADVPQMALLCRVPAIGANNIRSLILRGIPDIRVVEGEYSPSSAFNAALMAFFRSLRSFLFRGRDLSQPKIRIFAISTLGAVTTETPHGLAVNDLVRIQRTLATDGQFREGRFMVATVGPGTNAFTLTMWPFGVTTGGTVRKDAVVFPQVSADTISVSRIITRRVGRPFTQYRGRRSKRQPI